MMYGLLNDSHADDFKDFSPLAKWVLIVLLALVVFSVTGCGSPGAIKQVDRNAPPSAMVRMDPLPHQTDPTLGGIFKGYVNAAQQYRQCVGNLTELQDWVLTLPQ